LVDRLRALAALAGAQVTVHLSTTSVVDTVEAAAAAMAALRDSEIVVTAKLQEAFGAEQLREMMADNGHNVVDIKGTDAIYDTDKRVIPGAKAIRLLLASWEDARELALGFSEMAPVRVNHLELRVQPTWSLNLYNKFGESGPLWHKLVCFSHTFQPKKPLPLLRWDLPAETKGADSISGVYWDPLPGAWTGER
jgi:hypothetical protein